MVDTIRCPGCGKQYPSNPKYLGKGVRCKYCGRVFRVSSKPPEPVAVAKPVEENKPNDVEGYGISDVSDLQTAMLNMGKFEATDTTQATLPKRRVAKLSLRRRLGGRKNNVGSLSTLLIQHKLATVAMAWSILVGIIFCSLGSTSLFLGFIVVALGVAIGLLGYFFNADIESASNRKSPININSRLGGGISLGATVFVVVAIIAKFFLRFSRHNEGMKKGLEEHLEPYTPAMIIIAAIFFTLFICFNTVQRYGFFRTVLGVYMVVSFAYAMHPVWWPTIQEVIELFSHMVEVTR